MTEGSSEVALVTGHAVQPPSDGAQPTSGGTQSPPGGAQLPPELEQEVNRINAGSGRYISKAVTFVLTPLLLPLATSFAYGVQKWFGLKLDAAQLTGYITAIAGGIGITLYKWLANRGEWERTVLQLSQWYKLNVEAQASGQAPPGPAPHR
jgi:hypothetical protein